MKIDFHLVVTNRDKIKIDGVHIPVWEFIDMPLKNKLTSLEYCPPFKSITGRVMYDCGAWSYKDKELPKWNVDQCLMEYDKYAKDNDFVVSPDHMVLKGMSPLEAQNRIDITLNNAKEFITKCPLNLIPIAVTHGDDIDTRKRMAETYLELGYKRIALGGVAGRTGRLKTNKGYTTNSKFVLDIIEAMIDVGVKEIHVLGVGSLPWVLEYQKYPQIKSYDTASMFKNAFAGGYFYWVNEESPEKIIKYKATREQNIPNGLPSCNCLACVSLRSQGIDTRTYGSNENNMGRAIHNVNMYLRTLDLLGIDYGKE